MIVIFEIVGALVLIGLLAIGAKTAWNSIFKKEA